MPHLARCLVPSATAAAIAVVAACGSSDGGSAFGNPGSDAGGGAAANGGSGGASGGGATISSGSVGGAGAGGDGGSVTTTSPSCNAVTKGAALLPVNLVVMLDRSGSMGNDKMGDKQSQKWDPVTSALEAFFGDASSTGISASLQFFSQGNDDAQCQASTYETPAVAFQTLPNAKPFTAAISATGPGGDTPTLPAITGALSYAAKQRSADTTGAVFAVVFVTDGDPNGCNSTVDNVPAVAKMYASGADPLLTYVVGVGTNSSALEAIATGGGTTEIAVDVGDPAKTSSDLIAALGSIRQQSVSCTFPIPPPPTGQIYAANAVTVTYTPSGGTAMQLPYDASCTMSGWHYDNPADPGQIVLCGDTCKTVKADPAAALSVSFGCEVTTGTALDGGVVIVR